MTIFEEIEDWNFQILYEDPDYHEPGGKMKAVLTIILSQEDYDEAFRIGKRRRGEDIVSRAKEKIFSKKDPGFINIQGAVGEMVFARMFDFEMEKDTTPRKGGVDFVCESGLTIDVKHTENTENPVLRNPAYKTENEFHADIYVLIGGKILENLKFGMYGWTFHADLMMPKNEVNGVCELDVSGLRRNLFQFLNLIGRPKK